MKIKVAVLDKDVAYLKGFLTAFGMRFSERIELRSYTDKDLALKDIETSQVDVVLVSDEFNLDPSEIHAKCGFAYFVSGTGVESINGQLAIHKYQKADLIYKQLLSLYAENAQDYGFASEDEKSKVIMFTSPAGGTGASALAAAAALHFAKQGKKTVYLNLEKYGSADVYFDGEGQFSLSDVIIALEKNRKTTSKTNVFLKMESSIKQDPRGVFFFSQTRHALEMQEFTISDMIESLKVLKKDGEYDYIIVDADFSLDEENLKLYQMMNSVVIVSNGTEVANRKITRAYEALKTLEESKEYNIISRICLAYNIFSNKTGTNPDKLEVRMIGGAPRFQHAVTQEILEDLSKYDMFDHIFGPERSETNY